MRSITMFRLQELVRLHRMDTGCHEAARLLGMSPNTERHYRAALARKGLLVGAVDELPSEEQLRAAVRAYFGKEKAKPQNISSIAAWLGQIETWLGNGAQPTAIYDRLKRECPDFTGSISAVKRACLSQRKARGVQAEDVSIPVQTEPGAVAQVDFGYVGKLFDSSQQVLRKAYVFVMVLGHSRHQYCEIVFDQKVETWLRVHANAFEWFGGVPETIVPDNLKSAVVKCAFSAGDEVSLNRSYRELARHFGFKIDPAPPHAPKKKGKVESGVKYVKNNFFKSYGQDVAAEELQTLLERWVKTTAGQRIHGTMAKRPLDVFESHERAALKPLPMVRFEPVVWKKVKVHEDTHVLFNKALYSVPWRSVGCDAMLRATPSVVQIFIDDIRVATHARGKPGQHVTLEEHLPERRRELRERSRQYWEKRADAVGSAAGAYVREFFDSDDVLSQLRQVQAIVGYLEQFPKHRAEAACRRASFYASYQYRALKNILVRGLDQEPLPEAANATAVHTRFRFSRNIQELLDFHREEHNEPN